MTNVLPSIYNIVVGDELEYDSKSKTLFQQCDAQMGRYVALLKNQTSGGCTAKDYHHLGQLSQVL